MLSFFHADNEDSDQTSRVSRLILVFVGLTRQKVRVLTLRLKEIWTVLVFAHHCILSFQTRSPV